MFSAKHYALVGKTLCLDTLTRSSNVLLKTFSVILEINVNKVIIIMTSFVSVLAIIGLFYGKSHKARLDVTIEYITCCNNLLRKLVRLLSRLPSAYFTFEWSI